MRELPQCIYFNSQRISEAFNGVEDEKTRSELQALSILIDKNQIALGVIQILTGKTMSSIEAGCYLWQNISDDGQIMLLLLFDMIPDGADIDEALAKIMAKAKL